MSSLVQVQPTSVAPASLAAPSSSSFPVHIKGFSACALLEQINPTPAHDAALQVAFEAVAAVFRSLGNVVKVGSFGKKTHIIAGQAEKPDLDVVVLLPPFRREEHAAKMASLEKEARKQPNFTALKVGTFSLQFTFQEVEVDLLPGMALDDPVRFLMQMQGDRLYHACASYGHTKFIRAQPRKYRQLVRLVKWWKKQHVWPSDNTAPVSHLLELLTLHVFNRDATQESTLEELFEKVMQLFSREPAALGQSRDIILFNSFYNADYVRRNMQAFEVNAVSSISPHPSESPFPFRVFDPINPHNDIASSLRNSSPLREYARATLAEMQQSLAHWAATLQQETEGRLQEKENQLAMKNVLIAFQSQLMHMPRSLELRLPFTKPFGPCHSSVMACAPLLKVCLGIELQSVETTQYGRTQRVPYIFIYLQTEYTADPQLMRSALPKGCNLGWSLEFVAIHYNSRYPSQKLTGSTQNAGKTMLTSTATRIRTSVQECSMTQNDLMQFFGLQEVVCTLTIDLLN